MKKARKQIIESSEISEVREVNLGGFPQKIMLDGKKKSNPVVICPHGGPGSPIPFSVGSRGMFPEITEKLTFEFYGTDMRKVLCDLVFCFTGGDLS